MPRGWEENVTANGEVYYINHVTRTTHWEDPRISTFLSFNFNVNNSELIFF